MNSILIDTVQNVNCCSVTKIIAKIAIEQNCKKNCWKIGQLKFNLCRNDTAMFMLSNDKSAELSGNSKYILLAFAHDKCFIIQLIFAQIAKLL